MGDATINADLAQGKQLKTYLACLQQQRLFPPATAMIENGPEHVQKIPMLRRVM